MIPTAPLLHTEYSQFVCVCVCFFFWRAFRGVSRSKPCCSLLEKSEENAPQANKREVDREARPFRFLALFLFPGGVWPTERVVVVAGY